MEEAGKITRGRAEPLQGTSLEVTLPCPDQESKKEAGSQPGTRGVPRGSLAGSVKFGGGTRGLR